MHKIYWFSGTGNTYWLAREFARHFPGAELISIASLDRSEDVVFDADFTGIFSLSIVSASRPYCLNSWNGSSP